MLQKFETKLKPYGLDLLSFAYIVFMGVVADLIIWNVMVWILAKAQF